MKEKLPPSEAMSKALQTLLDGGTDANDVLGEVIRLGTEVLLQRSLESEVTDFLGRGHYERIGEGEVHRGYRNGYRERRLKTTNGRLSIQEPRVRQSEEPYESRLLGRIDKIEERLETMALEMYTRGLSTRDIEQTLTDEDGRALLSRSAVSRLTEELFSEYEEFATRDLSGLDIVYLFVDGVYEAVRRYTRGQAILCAWAILSDGTKTIVHLEAAASESEASWEAFFEDVLGRGMAHPLLVVSDGGPAVIAAIMKCLPQSKRQRCIAHKLRNLSSKMPLQAREQLLAEIKSIYYASDKEAAELLATRFVDTHAQNYPSVVKCLNDDLDACLEQLSFPLAHRKFIRTTNLLERAFVEEKRRTKIIPAHVNERGAIKLVFGSLIRASASWRRVAMTQLELAQLRTLRMTMCPHENESETISFRLAA